MSYPRLYASVIGIWPTGSFHGVLYRLETRPSGGVTYAELARCRHFHRNRRKAIECAERLGQLDGAPVL